MSNFWGVPEPIREPEFEITNGSNGKLGIESKGGLILYHPIFDSIVRFDVYDSDICEKYVYRLERNGKYGLIELKYFLEIEVKELLSIEYDELKQITYDYPLFIIAKNDKKYGLYSQVSEWILPLEHDNMTVVSYKDDWSEFIGRREYLLFQKDGKYGMAFTPYFFTRKTCAEFEEILPPIDEFGVRVKKDGVWGYLDKDREFTPNLTEVPQKWETLCDVHITGDARILHEVNRGKKQIKSEIDIPSIDIDF